MCPGGLGVSIRSVLVGFGLITIPVKFGGQAVRFGGELVSLRRVIVCGIGHRLNFSIFDLFLPKRRRREKGAIRRRPGGRRVSRQF
jgi:hypothetical protein